MTTTTENKTISDQHEAVLMWILGGLVAYVVLLHWPVVLLLKSLGVTQKNGIIMSLGVMFVMGFIMYKSGPSIEKAHHFLGQLFKDIKYWFDSVHASTQKLLGSLFVGFGAVAVVVSIIYQVNSTEFVAARKLSKLESDESLKTWHIQEEKDGSMTVHVFIIPRNDLPIYQNVASGTDEWIGHLVYPNIGLESAKMLGQTVRADNVALIKGEATIGHLSHIDSGKLNLPSGWEAAEFISSHGAAGISGFGSLEAKLLPMFCAVIIVLVFLSRNDQAKLLYGAMTGIFLSVLAGAPWFFLSTHLNMVLNAID